jgi:hypothetical protein
MAVERLTRMRGVVNQERSSVLTNKQIKALWKIAADDLIGIGDSVEVHGELGGFLLKSVKVGQVLGIYGSVQITEADLRAMLDRSYVYTANVEVGSNTETIIIDGTPGDGPGSYLNTSFVNSLNVGIEVRKLKEGTGYQVVMVSLTDIEQGEEGLCEYGPEYWLPLRSNC